MQSIPGDSNGIAAQKRSLRRDLLGILNDLSEAQRRESDTQIRRHVAATAQYQSAKRLFIFVGDGWEVDTRPLIEVALAAGKQVAVPRCLPLPQTAKGIHSKEVSRLTGQNGQGRESGPPKPFEGGVMEACLIRSCAELRRVPPLGLWEPAAGAPLLPPAEIDFAIIPCVACDAAGRRLGRGGGYYDRFLRLMESAPGSGHATKAALCRQSLLQQEVPTEAHDQRMDMVITENGVLRVAY